MAARMMETKKGGRDDNDHSGHVVQSGNPVPRLAGNQPARKLPIQMYKVKASPLFGLNRQWAFLSHSCSLVHGLVHCFLEVSPMFPTIPTSSVLVLAWH